MANSKTHTLIKLPFYWRNNKWKKEVAVCAMLRNKAWWHDLVGISIALPPQERRSEEVPVRLGLRA